MRLSVGVDVVSVARIARLTRRYGRAAERLFTPQELDYCRGSRRCHERMAVRFAAKEAVLKALGTGFGGGMRWTDVEVVNEASGRPMVRLKGRVAELAERSGSPTLEVSLSHTDEIAVAQAVALWGDPPPAAAIASEQ